MINEMLGNLRIKRPAIRDFATYILKILLIAIVYHLAARVGLRMAYVQINTSPVWPPTGIALAALLIFGYNVWPEMLDALREAGWHNYTLFLRNDGLIFGYFETEESLATAQGKMTTREVNKRWQQFMASFTDANARPDESFVELEEYFHLD